MTIIPGLNDAHLHLLGLGRALRQVDLVGTSSYAEVLSLIKAKIMETPPDLWIQGRGWDQNDWPEKEFPTNADLNAISPDHFIFVKRIDGHAALANHRVLQAAGITRSTPDPPGGKIIRRANGDPTGVLIDNAMELVSPVIPQPTLQEDSIALELAMQSCLRVGLTSVHDPGIDTTGLRVYRHAGLNGQLKIRVYAMLDGMDTALVTRQFSTGPEIGLYDHFFSLVSVKLYADGALGSRGAALIEPYDDDRGNRGLLLTPPPVIERLTVNALRAGFQVCTHAIGDRGNREVLTAYAAALNQTGMDGKQKRLRIEHAQVVHPDDISRFAQLGIVASMQPTHCTSDMYWAEQRIGPNRIRGAYAWRSMRQAGVVLAGGSDAPVESNNPLWGIYAAVTRKDHKLFPESGWQPQEKLDRMESVSMFTRDAAYAEFEENFKGRIRPGMAADLTVLSKDIMTVEPSEILSTQVLMTIVDGRIAFKR
jgi:predicted amidohydrolase YtcJ